MAQVLIQADSRYPVSRPKIKAAVDAVLKERRISSNVEVSILICGRRKSEELAKKYLKDNKPHNVLSFPLESFPVLGDIVICYPIAQDEASSVVYGMPGEAIRLDAATYVLPPATIAAVLVALVKR